MTETVVQVTAAPVRIEGNITDPAAARGMVLFGHGSGSSRHSPRNRFVAGELQKRALGTFLIDLLTADEDAVDMRTREHRFDIGLLARRLVAATEWLEQQSDTKDMKLGYFGASTGAAAASAAAAKGAAAVAAVVPRGGRPDVAGKPLRLVKAPTLRWVGGDDREVISLTREAGARMRVENKIVIVMGASHLFSTRIRALASR